MLWITFYAVEYMLWRTMTMLPTPYAYGVGNTYGVGNVLCAVGAYSVGDILWIHDHAPWSTCVVDTHREHHNHTP